MNRTLRGYLQLVRLPNLFTAAADSVAGYLYAGGGLEGWPAAAVVAAASVLLYAGGVSLNDVLDADLDAVKRPERPIPSGLVARRSGALLAVLLLVAGATIAFAVHARCGLAAAAIVVSILLYDGGLKRNPVGPAFMGACRALNLLLGIAAVAPLLSLQAVVPAAVMWLYVTALTAFARGESGLPDPYRLRAAGAAMALSILALAGLAWALPTPELSYLPLAAALLVFVVRTVDTAAARPEPALVQQAVGRLVLCIALLDVCIVWAARGAWPSLAPAALLLLAVLARRAWTMS